MEKLWRLWVAKMKRFDAPSDNITLMSRTVAIVTMGCARNEVDSEELAGRLAADGWTLVEDVENAEVAVVNTCGFIESAKKIPWMHFSKPTH